MRLNSKVEGGRDTKSQPVTEKLIYIMRYFSGYLLPNSEISFTKLTLTISNVVVNRLYTMLLLWLFAFLLPICWEKLRNYDSNWRWKRNVYDSGSKFHVEEHHFLPLLYTVKKAPQQLWSFSFFQCSGAIYMF